VNNKLVPAGKAKSIGFSFIQNKYHRAKVTIDQVSLVTDGAFPVYHLKGNLEIPSRGTISTFLSPASEYVFEIQVHAQEGSILNYELC